LPNSADRKTAQRLHNDHDMVIRLAQQFQHHRRRANLVKILHRRLIIALVALREQADDLVLRQRFVE
jgi:hypothetical protein